MTVTPDAVEAAARALFEHRQDNLELDQEGDEWGDLPPSWQEEWRDAAEDALAAAAPLIAADAWDEGAARAVAYVGFGGWLKPIMDANPHRN